MARAGSFGAPGSGRGGPGPKKGRSSAPGEGARGQAARPSLPFGEGEAGRPSGASGRRPIDSENNPWRRAALALERAKSQPIREEPDQSRRPDGKVAVGRLGAPRGVGGDLRVQSYSGETAHILALKTVELAREREGLPETRLHLKVIRTEEGPGGLTLAFEGYSSPERATVLAGMEILVDRAQSAPLRDNEWYTADLVGLRLVAPGGGTVYGLVLAVCEGGPDPWLEVERGSEPRALVPFRKEFIGAIDLGAGTIELLSPWVLE